MGDSTRIGKTDRRFESNLIAKSVDLQFSALSHEPAKGKTDRLQGQTNRSIRVESSTFSALSHRIDFR